MPIAGLVDNIKPTDGLPRLGKLHKGAKRGADDLNKRRPGKDLDYFRVQFEPQFEHLQPVWDALYGDKPTYFDEVLVAGEQVDDVFSFWMEDWSATALLHRCDREAQVQHYNPQLGRYSHARVDCAAEATPACQCRPVGRLNLIFGDLIDQTGALGYIIAETHSINDIITLYKRLQAYAKMLGSLQGVKFKFGRSTEQISAPKVANGARTGDRMKIKKSLFYLHLNEDFTRAEVLPLLQARPASAPQLPSGETPRLSASEIEAARRRLGNGGPRRIGANAQIPDPDHSDLPRPDFDEGEFDEPEQPEASAAEPATAADDPLMAFWTVETLKPSVIDLFKNEHNYYAAVKNYRDAEHDEFLLPPDITLTEAEARVRFYRSRTGKAELRIFEDERVREGFIGACADLVENDRAVIEALDAVTDYPVGGLTGWKGDKATAWAAVLAAAALYVVRVAVPVNAKPVTAALVTLVCEHVTGLSGEDSLPPEPMAETA